MIRTEGVTAGMAKKAILSVLLALALVVFFVILIVYVQVWSSPADTVCCTCEAPLTNMLARGTSGNQIKEFGSIRARIGERCCPCVSMGSKK